LSERDGAEGDLARGGSGGFEEDKVELWGFDDEGLLDCLWECCWEELGLGVFLSWWVDFEVEDNSQFCSILYSK
jgi:hypothetical protein